MDCQFTINLAIQWARETKVTLQEELNIASMINNAHDEKSQSLVVEVVGGRSLFKAGSQSNSIQW